MESGSERERERDADVDVRIRRREKGGSRAIIRTLGCFVQSRPSEELVRNRARSASVCLFSLQWCRRAIMLQTSRYVELPFPNFGEGEVLVRRSIAFSFGACSHLKLTLCMERTLAKDETQNQFTRRRPRVSVDRYSRKNEPQSASQWGSLRSLWVQTQRMAWNSHRKDGIGCIDLLCVRGEQAWLPTQSASDSTASL